jgi:hypothetical protein
VKNAGHNDILNNAGGEYRERLRSFYETLPEARAHEIAKPLPRGQRPWTLPNN